MATAVKGEIGVRDFVFITGLRNSRYPQVGVYGRVFAIQGDEAEVLVPRSFGYGYSVKQDLSTLEYQEREEVPHRQLLEICR